MRGIYKLVKYIFTTFCKIFTRIKTGAYITCSQLCVIFSFWKYRNASRMFKISGEALLWGSGVYNKNF